MSFYVPLPLDTIPLGAPIPINVWEADGTLLLRKGEVIETERHRINLMAHSPVVLESDFKAWTYSYTTQLDRMVRRNESINKLAEATRPTELSTAEQPDNMDPVTAWPDLQAALATLLHQNAEAHDFVSRLVVLEARAQRLVQMRPDDALFMLLLLLHDRTLSYCASHALLCAVMCELVAPVAGVPAGERQSLFRAAITMNIGMARLQDELLKQAGPVTDGQREEIHSHPLRSLQLLKALGVGDTCWLQLVADHHETPQGDGYPAGKTDLGAAQQLLHLVDVFVARLSPRRSRPGLAPQQAARAIYLNEAGEPNAIGAALVKTLGIYPPGSYVRLANDEGAVVVRRGRRANAPLAFSIVGRQGLPMGEPALRDTLERAYEVKASVPAEEIKVVVNAAKLLSRV